MFPKSVSVLNISKGFKLWLYDELMLRTHVLGLHTYITQLWSTKEKPIKLYCCMLTHWFSVKCDLKYFLFSPIIFSNVNVQTKLFTFVRRTRVLRVYYYICGRKKWKKSVWLPVRLPFLIVLDKKFPLRTCLDRLCLCRLLVFDFFAYNEQTAHEMKDADDTYLEGKKNHANRALTEIAPAYKSSRFQTEVHNLFLMWMKEACRNRFFEVRLDTSCLG